MTYTLIEINDISLRVWRDGSLVCESPGIIHANPGGMLFDESALAKSRSEPLGLRAHHWSNIDLVPLKRPDKIARHHADLVYRHLEHLQKKHGPLENIIFLLPSEITHEQLGLLLGITKSLKLEVAGLVDIAVANVASLQAAYPQVQYIELSQFRTTISDIRVDNHVSFESLQTLARSGKDYLTNLGISWVADCFLEQARFDPLEQAQTEQIIFDKLDTWVEMLGQSGNINVALEHLDRRREVSLAKSALLKSLLPGLSPIAEALTNETPVILSHRFNMYPRELFQDLFGEREIIRRKPFELFESLESWTAEITSRAEEMVFVRTLSRQPKNIQDLKTVQDQSIKEKLSHVAINGQNHKLSNTPLFVQKDGSTSDTTSAENLLSLTATLCQRLTPTDTTEVLLGGLPMGKSHTPSPGDYISMPNFGVDISFYGFDESDGP